MRKYEISSEYGIYSKYIPPFNRCIFPITTLILNIIPKMLKSDENVKITTRIMKVSDGRNIKLYVFEPINLKTDKVLLYIHGGGFVFKGSPHHYNLCKRFAMQGNCKVIYVDYRLSPKYKYPIPLDDCFSAYKYIIKNADNLRINTNKIVIGGDSAGGLLSVDVTLRAIQENIVRPCYQMLIYPLLDKRMNTESMKEYNDTPMWNAKLNKKMWKYYLGSSNYISPNEILDLTDFPPTYLETAEFDCLHDEGIEFANKLINNGIDVSVYETKQTMHGYDIKNCSITEKAIKKRIEILNTIPCIK